MQQPALTHHGSLKGKPALQTRYRLHQRGYRLYDKSRQLRRDKVTKPIPTEHSTHVELRRYKKPLPATRCAA